MSKDNASLVQELKAQVAFLDAMANQLDGWAAESRRGGWSTHQVSANESAANDCRRMAASARVLLQESHTDE